MSVPAEKIKNQLVIVDVNTAITEADKFDEQIAELEKQFKDRVYDMANKKQNQEARSDRLKLSRFAKVIDDTRITNKKELEKSATYYHNCVLAKHKRVVVLRDAIKEQVDTWDAEEKRIEEEAAKAKEVLEAKMLSLSQLHLISGNETAAELNIRITEVLKIDIDDSYGDRKVEAKKLVNDAIASLQMFHENILEAEKEKTELDQLRREKEEREAKEKAEAEAAAKKARDEEIAEKARQEEREKIEEEQKNKETEKPSTVTFVADTYHEAISETTEQQQEPEDSTLIPNHESMREEDIKRVKNREALEDLMICGFLIPFGDSKNDIKGKRIIAAIAHGKIRNVTINY